MSSGPEMDISEELLQLLSNKKLARAPEGLDAADDLEFFLVVVGEALRADEDLETNTERAKWAVAQWCQEVGYVPDLRDYEVGECVPHSDVPEDRETAELRELKTGGDGGEVGNVDDRPR